MSPDVTMNLTDGESPNEIHRVRERCALTLADTFIQLADGKLNGQKAFMTGALKVKGNVMLAVSRIRIAA